MAITVGIGVFEHHRSRRPAGDHGLFLAFLALSRNPGAEFRRSEASPKARTLVSVREGVPCSTLLPSQPFTHIRGGERMSTMDIHARVKFDLRIGPGKESSQEATTEEAPLVAAALPAVEATRRKRLWRALLSSAVPVGVVVLKWALRIHGFPI